ncbi:MAG: ASCH domain-containing protein [Planctomycetota bacterium]|nr:ASCH domain-containing protein [Planctomycetota bacterium]
MSTDARVQAFWERYTASLPADAPVPEQPEAWAFGVGPEMADALGRLVVDGTKTGTCSLLWEYEHEGEALPAVGELGIVLDGEGAPLCLIETTAVTQVPFDEVDAKHAAAEGEGDRSLAHWREVHWRFFTRLCEKIGREVSETMPLVCERFRVVFA